MSYQGSDRLSQHLYQTLTANARLVEILGHSAQTPRIIRGISPLRPPHPSAFFFTGEHGPMLDETNEVIEATAQISAFATSPDQPVLDETARLLRDIFNPTTAIGPALGGLIHIMYVEWVPIGNVIYEDNSRALLRIDVRFRVGYVEL